jgi:DNA-binding LytR/AlgR family response regulator
MKYNIAIVEDNTQSADKIKDFLERYTKENQVDFNIYQFLDGDEITSDYEAKYDIIFLDIEMKRLDGMSAAKKIREFDSDVIIIFITNMSQYAILGYSVGAMSFLLKPVPYFAFSQELKKSIERLSKRKHKPIMVPNENGVNIVYSRDILYIESFHHSLIIVTNDAEFTIRGTIKKMEEELADFHFYRCNNGYLVNLSQVKGVKDELVMVGKHELKISRPRKKSFLDALNKYIGGNLL